MLEEDLLTFATGRQTLIDRLEDSLMRSVRIALARYPRQGWESALLRRIERVFRDQYKAEFDEDLTDTTVLTSLVASAKESLSKVEDVPESHRDQTQRISEGLAVAIANGVTEARGMESDEPMSKTWVTMEDTSVRPAHKSLHLVTVPVGESFEVAEVKMSRPGDMSAPPALWVNCRCVLAIGPTSQTAAGILANTTTGGTMEEDIEVPFYGVLAPEGVPTRDGRRFAVGSMRWIDPPVPLLWQKYTDEGHNKSVIVGNMDQLWRDEETNLLRVKGRMLHTAEAEEATNLMAEGALRGVSVDVYDATVEIQDLAGNSVDMDEIIEKMAEGEIDDDVEYLQTLVDGEIAGATLVAFPAFREAYLSLGTGEEEDKVVEKTTEEDSEADIAASAEGAQEFDVDLEFVDVAPGKTEDGPGWLTHPVDTDRLRDYWVRGAGAAKIGWGLPGDFNRCRANLAKYIKPQYLSGYCANRHYDALGFWPGQHHSALSASAVEEERGEPWTVIQRPMGLTASAGPVTPPRSWFSDPGLVEPSPVVVTEEGRIFGHLAAWGVCHIGIQDVCTVAPHSATNYAQYRTGERQTDEGPVAVGQVTLGTGHAKTNLRAASAVAHYDNTGTAVADVVTGEDSHGIWVAGAVRPYVTDKQVMELRASALSGDWRLHQGNLELVAALAVNVPGFPIPRPSLAASGGQQVSLVAAGVVSRATFSEEDIETIVDRVLSRRAEEKAAKAELAAIASARAKAELAAIAAERSAL